MARRNIFEIINDAMSFKRELSRIEELLHAKSGVKVDAVSASAPESAVKFYPFEAFVDDTAFKKWKSRGTCISCKDMRETLGIPSILAKDAPSMNDVLTYLEYVSNLFFLFKNINLRLGFHFYDTNITIAARENVRKVLDWLNYEAKELEAEEKVLVVEKNAATTALAEISEPSFALSVIQYNHYTLKGDLEAKKEILLSMGRQLELHKLNLADVDMMLAEGINYLMNNLNLLHDNCKKKDVFYRDVVGRMPPKKLEEWYDDLYQMLLLAFLELDHVERDKRYRELRAQIDRK